MGHPFIHGHPSSVDEARSHATENTRPVAKKHRALARKNGKGTEWKPWVGTKSLTGSNMAIYIILYICIYGQRGWSMFGFGKNDATLHPRHIPFLHDLPRAKEKEVTTPVPKWGTEDTERWIFFQRCLTCTQDDYAILCLLFWLNLRTRTGSANPNTFMIIQGCSSCQSLPKERRPSQGTINHHLRRGFPLLPWKLP